VTHLVDTSVWHRYGSSPAVQEVVDGLVSRGGLLTTCPVVISEYCFSARSATELHQLRNDLAMLYLLESDELTPFVRDIQSALWSTGRVRAAGSPDCLIAAYALEHDQTLVTCEEDFLHISRSLTQVGSQKQLRVIHVRPGGSVASVSL
jgi:predicted nucleic acid-binding protein